MRTFTKFCTTDPVAKNLVNELPEIKGSPARYRQQMLEIGKHLGKGIVPSLDRKSSADICVVCTVEDADFLARGLIEKLEEVGLEQSIHLICLWNDKIKEEGVSISPIRKEYKEEFNKENSIFIIVKSIISGACVVKTNLTRAISSSNPKQIFVASPVMLDGAEQRLSAEFPSSIHSKFEFVHFATDTEKNGEDVFPGIGGSVYELLGLGNSKEKNKYMPMIVKERRARLYNSSPVFA